MRHGSYYTTLPVLFLFLPQFTERILESYLQEVGEEFATRDIPLGKLATPEDVANVVAFLASGLAPHTTGATIDINGASYVR